MSDSEIPELNEAERASERPSLIAPSEKQWAAQDSAELYQIKGWGQPYFSVGEGGRVLVSPDPDKAQTIDLFALTQDLQARGLELPLLVRFSDILGDRVRRINECFRRAIAEHEYPNHYRGVYPVKVNQQRHVVQEIVKFGKKWNYGLEVGSKPELLIALSSSTGSGDLIICNGYKDRSYIETALIAQQFDKTVIIVLERLEELQFAIDASKKLGIVPMLGVRAKLSSKGMGRWSASAGDNAKFGLSVPEIIELVDSLTKHEMLGSLRLLHFHIGSQVSSIIPIKNALKEAANIYVELARMGCQMGYFDVGGGLAIDYDGSKTDFHASRNYTLHEYASDVVVAIQDACSKADLPPPTLVSESGRAAVAHQSVLVFDVVGVNQVSQVVPPDPEPDAHGVITVLCETYRGIKPKNVQESWHDACQAKEEAQSLFKYGYLGLRDRSIAERWYWACCRKIEKTLKRLRFVPEELQSLAKQLSAIYYCNFSIFQSAPDAWAINQLFPIMPIHRLDEEPTVRATLADLTCDSDGIIDHFIDVEDVQETLPVHPIEPGDPYYLAMFLNGAYQEILGDLHNLFGDTNAVHVSLSEYGYRIDHVIKGDSVTEVLHYVAYTAEEMTEAVRSQAEEALSAGKMTLQQMRLFMGHYEAALNSYTYLSQ